jgi:tetratricopeptide (TPR) repeat protein
LGGQRLEEAAGLLEDAAQWAEEHGQPEAAVDAGIEGALCRYLLREYEAAARSLDVAETRLARLRTDGGRAPMTGPCLEVELEHTRGLILARAEGGDLTDALQAFERALRLAAGLGDPGRFARVAQSVGETQRRGGRLDAADRYIRLAVRYKERRGDLAGLAVAYGGLGRVALGRGEREEAARWFRRDLELSLRIGDWRGAGVAGNALGEIHEETYLEGQNPADRVRARAAYDKAREAAGRSGNRIDHAISLFYRGRFLSRAGDEPDRYFGLAELEEGLRIFRELGRDLEARKVENALAVARSGLASGGDP